MERPHELQEMSASFTVSLGPGNTSIFRSNPNTLDTVCSSKAGQCFFEVADGLNWTKKKDGWMSFCHGSFKVNNLHMHSFWMEISCSCFSLLLQ